MTKKDTIVGIVGSGIVGQATGKGLVKKGFSNVFFIDIDKEKLEKISLEGFLTRHVDDDLPDIDVYFMCIQTPTLDSGEADTDYMENALRSVGQKIKTQEKFPIVLTRSTVPVGSGEKLIVPTLEKESGKENNVDFGVCSNPEFLREKSALEDFLNPRIIILGCEDDKTLSISKDLYSVFDVPVHILSMKEAEVQKYVHNLFNATKISFFNEQRRVFQDSGLDVDKIFKAVSISSEASWNQEYGIGNFGPYGGSCLPKDVKAFITWAEKEKGIKVPLLKAVDQVNENTIS